MNKMNENEGKENNMNGKEVKKRMKWMKKK